MTIWWTIDRSWSIDALYGVEQKYRAWPENMKLKPSGIRNPADSHDQSLLHCPPVKQCWAWGSTGQLVLSWRRCMLWLGQPLSSHVGYHILYDPTGWQIRIINLDSVHVTVPLLWSLLLYSLFSISRTFPPLNGRNNSSIWFFDWTGQDWGGQQINPRGDLASVWPPHIQLDHLEKSE